MPLAWHFSTITAIKLMKKLIIALIILAATTSTAMAESKVPARNRLYTSNEIRKNIILPQVNGYNCYKADFHCHTIYSDGQVTPAWRVREAWLDGLDIIAITDHLEVRRYEPTILKHLRKYNPDGEPHKYVYAGSAKVPVNDDPVMSDFNVSYEEAEKAAKKYPVHVIKGIEISRTKATGSDYNALFVKDIEKIYDKDHFQVLRNAKEQGCLVIHNHPVIGRAEAVMTEFEKAAMAEGLFDGIEVASGYTFYPPIVKRALENKMFMVAATDSHIPTSSGNFADGIYRTMTLIFAKENNEKCLKEALKARRTLGYCGGHLIGEEQLLKDFFNAAVNVQLLSKDNKGTCTYALTNNSSIAFTLMRGSVEYTLPAMQVTMITIKGNRKKKAVKPRFQVNNMWHVDNQNLTIDLKVNK